MISGADNTFLSDMRIANQNKSGGKYKKSKKAKKK
jgi:hypothetical protein